MLRWFLKIPRRPLDIPLLRTALLCGRRHVNYKGAIVLSEGLLFVLNDGRSPTQLCREASQQSDVSQEDEQLHLLVLHYDE